VYFSVTVIHSCKHKSCNSSFEFTAKSAQEEPGARADRFLAHRFAGEKKRFSTFFNLQNLQYLQNLSVSPRMAFSIKRRSGRNSDYAGVSLQHPA
jgi:hypothetical protein